MLVDLSALFLVVIILSLYIFAPVIIIIFGGAWVMGRLLRSPSDTSWPSRGELWGIGTPFALSLLLWFGAALWWVIA